MTVPAYEAPRATPIYSFAALKTKQREIKDRAAEEVVHITENGNAAYIFCSEDVLAQEKARAVEEALYERRVMEVLREGRGRFCGRACIPWRSGSKSRSRKEAWSWLKSKSLKALLRI